MENFLKVRKEDFVNTFITKYPQVKPKDLHKELTAVNRDFGIVLYHDKGFLFDWGGDIIASKVNWGRYISSFNIDHITSVVTTGGNFKYISRGSTHAIHPNIYVKPCYIKQYNKSMIMKLCFWTQEPEITKLVSLGYIHPAIQVMKSMLESAAPGYAKWGGFNLPINKCKICDERITKEQGNTCSSCKKLDRAVSVR